MNTVTQHRRVLAQAFAAVVAVALLGGALAESLATRAQPFPGFLFWKNGMLVSFHRSSWTGADAGLPLNGGRILSVDGVPWAGGAELRERVAAAPSGTTFAYAIERRDGSKATIEVASMRLEWPDHLATFGVYLFGGFSFLLVAWVAFVLRPDLMAGRALVVASSTMGLLLTSSIDFLTGYHFVPAVQMVEALTPVAILYFALTFPEERFRVATRRRLTGVLLALFSALGIANVVLFEVAPWTARSISVVIYGAIAVAGLATIVRQGEALLLGGSTRARLQASMVFSATLAAFALPACAVLAFVVLRSELSFTWIAVLLPVFPFTVLYAVLRHDLLDAERVVRLTVGYALAAGAVVIAYALSLVGVEAVFGGNASPILSFVVLLALATGIEPLRRRGHRLLDRLFYRAAPRPGAVLERLGAELAGITRESEAVQRVEAAVREGLNTAHGALHLDERTDAADAELPFEPELEEPVCMSEERLGRLFVGPKLSGAPYSLVERELLRGIASQASLALANARSFEALRESELALSRQERLASIGELAGAVAHGVRNPLAGIRSTAQIALERSVDTDQRDLLTSILDGTERVDQRIRTLLDFSRPFVPKMERHAVSDLLEEVRKVFRRSADRIGASISVSCVPTDLCVRADRNHLEDALLELVGNALSSISHSGGHIYLEGSHSPPWVTLRVRDDGPGVPEPIRDRIFELFFSTRPEGSGMGLSSVRKIVERHGGQVSLEQRGASGCCFRIDLP